MNDKRNKEILADVVRTYIETGEPVSSRAISRRYAESLSTATIRNAMADLEDDGYLYQPHTSAGRVPTSAGYRFFVENISQDAQLAPDERDWIHSQLASAESPEQVMERASHVLATVSQALGIVVSPALSRTVIEHVRFMLLPDGRVLIVLITSGGLTRDKVVRVNRDFNGEELDRTADLLNRQCSGWTLEAIRSDLKADIARDRERYDRLRSNALLLCDPGILGEDASRRLYVEGAARIATSTEFTAGDDLHSLLVAIEERKRLIDLLTTCIEAPEPVHVQIGVKEMDRAGERLSLVAAPYAFNDQMQGGVGILGPMRMQYERAITTVACVAQYFNRFLSGS